MIERSSTARKRKAAPASAPSAHVLTAVPQSDRARAFVDDLRARLPGAMVIFARYDAQGAQTEVIIEEERGDASQQMEWLRVERLLKVRPGEPAARVTPPAVGLGAGRSGLVATYGINDQVFGLLIAIRDRSFSPAERRAVEETLTLGSELFQRLSVFDGEQTARDRAAERSVPAQYILDRDFSVVASFVPESDGLDPVHEILHLSEGLPPVVESAVRSLTSTWSDDPRTWRDGVAVPIPFMLVRVAPLTPRRDGEALRIGVTVERFAARNSLSYAARKFGMSSRELQVLSLVLQGHGTPEVAQTLAIAESTAHDHIKRMLVKARARNRVELAAKALGWR